MRVLRIGVDVFPLVVETDSRIERIGLYVLFVFASSLLSLNEYTFSFLFRPKAQNDRAAAASEEEAMNDQVDDASESTKHTEPQHRSPESPVEAVGKVVGDFEICEVGTSSSHRDDLIDVL